MLEALRQKNRPFSKLDHYMPLEQVMAMFMEVWYDDDSSSN